MSSTHFPILGQYSSRGTGGRFFASNHSKTVFPWRAHHPKPSSFRPKYSFAFSRHCSSDRCSKAGGQMMCGGSKSSVSLRGSPTPQRRPNLHVPAPILPTVSRSPTLLASLALHGDALSCFLRSVHVPNPMPHSVAGQQRDNYVYHDTSPLLEPLEARLCVIRRAFRLHPATDLR